MRRRWFNRTTMQQGGESKRWRMRLRDRKEIGGVQGVHKLQFFYNCIITQTIQKYSFFLFGVLVFRMPEF